MPTRLVIALAAALTAALAGCSTPPPAAARPETYAFWPPAPDEPRIQFARSFSFSSDVEPPRGAFDTLVFGTDQQVLPIAKPYGAAVFQGRIYVCDIVNPGVVILDLVTQQTRLMNTRGVERMLQPTAIAVAPDGMKYVADRRLGRIFVFDAADRHVLTFGEKGLVPAGIAVHGDELYLTEFSVQGVLVLDRRTGERLRTLGGPEEERGGFVRPLGIAVDRQGAIYVTDVIRGRLVKFAPDGAVLMRIGQIADSPGNFVRPKHVAVDEDGIIYVVDAAFQNVQMFDAEGRLLMFFGGPGDHPGSMSLPAGIALWDGDDQRLRGELHPAFDGRSMLVVTNQFGLHKVSVYALGGLRPGSSVADIAPFAAQVYDPDAAAQQPGAEMLGEPPAPSEPEEDEP